MSNIIENNKLIAEFMGYEILGDGKDIYCDIYPENSYVDSLPMLEFCFNDWNSIMPVVEKIESFIFENDEYYNVQILGGCYVYIISSHGNELVYVDNKESKLLCTYWAVLSFIQWYNKQQKIETNE